MSRERDRSEAMPSGEKELVWRVTEFLASENYRIRHEVPNMGQSVDIVATRAGRVTFVEVKLHDWRRALAQCEAHEPVADFIAIAVNVPSPTEQLLSEVVERGYGLICYDVTKRECAWALAPERNDSIWPPQRERISSIMRGIEHVR